MMIRMLIWKEWRDPDWKLTLGCVLLIGFTLIGLRSRLAPDQGILILGTFLGGFLFPILAGMDLVAAERADDTMDALLRLPVCPWKALTVKLVTGVVVCVVPVLAAGVLAALFAGGREMGSWYILRLSLATAGLAASVLIWVLAFGVRQNSEARAALVAMAVLAGWGLLAMIYGYFDHRLPKSMMVLLPGSFLVAIDPPDARWLRWVFPVQGLYAAVLLAWTFMRFGRPGRRTS